jgi:hypothetical protein
MLAFLAEVVSARMPQLTPEGVSACPGGEHHVSVAAAAKAHTVVSPSSAMGCGSQAMEWGDTAGGAAAPPMTAADRLTKRLENFSGQWALGSNDSVEQSLRKQKFPWIYRRIVTHMCRRINVTVRAVASKGELGGGSLREDAFLSFRGCTRRHVCL